MRRHIFDHCRSRTDDGMLANLDAVDDGHAQAYGGANSKVYMTPGGGSSAQGCIVSHGAVVFENRIRRNHCTLSYVRVEAYITPGHNERALAKIYLTAERGRGVNRGHELQLWYRTAKNVGYASAGSVVANANDPAPHTCSRAHLRQV